MEMEGIKAIIFDSGNTLNIPRTGHWFVTPNFFHIIKKEQLTCTEKQFSDAMKIAYDYIDKIVFVKTEEQEYLMFKEFYEILLKEINYPDISENNITLLSNDNVYNDDKFLFFDDVEPSIIRLKGDYLLGIVSDTWPSLERVFINKKLRQHFSTFIMSSVYGTNKSEDTLFKIAIDELGVKPQEAIFIDDNESNLIVAEKFGMVPILISRSDTQIAKSRYPIIKSLYELL